jgi:hypothetical protein
LKQDGRSYDCSSCPDRLKKLRRCAESREDFTEADGSLWPIILFAGGDSYGFCPAKASWDHEAVMTFKLLILASETGKLNLISGGIYDQPDWWIDNLTWFVPKYKHTQFVTRAQMILGDGKKSGFAANKPKRVK